MEVLRQFLDDTQLLDKTFKKKIMSGKSSAFPYTSTVTASYHTAGTELTGQSANNAEKVITIDGLLVTDVHINKLDELMEHWDNRAPYVEAMGNALAVQMDEHIMIEGLLGARASEVVTGSNKGGFVYSDDNLKIDAGGSADAGELLQAFFDALTACAKDMATKDVPKSMKKYVVVTEEMYHDLALATTPSGVSLYNKDYTGANGTIGDIVVPPIAGFTILASNHLPTGVIANTGNYIYHNGDFSKTVGLVFAQNAVGTLMLQDIKVENTGYMVRTKGELLTADYAVGHGWLRPECLGELSLNTLTNA